MSELRLKRRVAELEVSEAREREASKEANMAREALEEAFVRCEEKAARGGREASSREAGLQQQLAAALGRAVRPGVAQRPRPDDLTAVHVVWVGEWVGAWEGG